MWKHQVILDKQMLREMSFVTQKTWFLYHCEILVQVISQKSNQAKQHLAKFLSSMYLLVDKLLPLTSKSVALSLAVLYNHLGSFKILDD